MKIKYYVDKGKKPTPNHVFLVNWDKKWGDMVMCYCPIGQHSEAAVSYVHNCKEITRDEYIKYTDGIYTPADYLE